MYDSKFGWHATWIVPIGYVCLTYKNIKNYISTVRHKRKIKKILKDNPEIAELTKLSGIKND